MNIPLLASGSVLRCSLAGAALLSVAACTFLPVPARAQLTPTDLDVRIELGTVTERTVRVINTGRHAAFTLTVVEPHVFPGPISSWLRVKTGASGALEPGAARDVTLELSCPVNLGPSASEASLPIEKRVTQARLPLLDEGGVTVGALDVTLRCVVFS